MQLAAEGATEKSMHDVNSGAPGTLAPFKKEEIPTKPFTHQASPSTFEPLPPSLSLFIALLAQPVRFRFSSPYISTQEEGLSNSLIE